MRSLHVDGLAAFRAHRDHFRTHSHRSARSSDSSPPPPPATGSLADKLRGLSSALEFASLSGPCVLHVAGLDDELSPAEGHAADKDARMEEERRMLEVIRRGGGTTMTPLGGGSSRMVVGGGALGTAHLADSAVGTGDEDDDVDDMVVEQDELLSDATAPRVIVIVSTSRPFPPGYPIMSSLMQESVRIVPPDENYARLLWVGEDEEDEDEGGMEGTFDDALSGMLVGLRNAREIECLRTMFAIRRREEIEMGKTEEDGVGSGPSSSPVDVLRSLLPRLEASRSFHARPAARAGGGGPGALSAASLPDVRWEDIGGLDTIRREIADAVELPLRYPNLFAGTSGRSGVLLFGPPGTGKTLVAKAVARECGLPFLSVKGPELLGSYVGESEANIRGVFEAARSAAASASSDRLQVGEGHGVGGGGDNIRASVLFFDELDSLAPRRGETGHGDGVMDRVVATLLGELDGGGGGDGARGGGGASKKSGPEGGGAPHVIVIGATNRPDLLDPSLLRPGRFDRLLYLGPAKTNEHRLQILTAQTRRFAFEDGKDARYVLGEAVESFPPSLSGADLSAVASGALARALRRVCDRVEEEARSINDERRRRGGAGGSEEGADPVDVDEVMESWGADRLRPVVTGEDFEMAAKDVVPSISAEDLENFERLRRQFSSGQ